MIPGSDRIETITGDHTSIADEDQAVEPEALVQVGDGLADGGVVHFVAGPDVMRDRPAGHHHHGNDHLDVVRLAIAAVAVLGKIGRPGALEIGAGDVLARISHPLYGIGLTFYYKCIMYRHLHSIRKATR